MQTLEKKNVLVIGLGSSGQAASRLLFRRGAHVTAVDGGQSQELQNIANLLHAEGIQQVRLGVKETPKDAYDFAVLSPGISLKNPVVKGLLDRGVPVLGEFELGYRLSQCLNVGITGTNGKTTTTELVERLLTQSHRKTVAAGNIGLPVCAVVDQTKDLDYLTLEVSSFQLETTEFYRPAVAVFMNLTPDHLDRYGNMEEYLRAKARIFMNQQPFDWAIVQSEALAQIRSLNIPIRSKVITFSATSRRADLFLDRSLIVSQIADWSGPLLDLDDCHLKGPHNAENLMAALAVGRVLRLPLEEMQRTLKNYVPAPHRCEVIAAINGVKFVNDSKATNLDAVQKALQTMPVAKVGEPNIILIAGGRDKGFLYHDIGPLLAQRVKHAFLIGETREKLRAAWSLFTPCTTADSLLEAVFEAAKKAASGDIVLLSPACSSFDMFQDYKHRGEVFRQAVEQWARTINGSASVVHTITGAAHAKPIEVN